MRASTYVLQVLSVVGMTAGLVLMILTLGAPKLNPGLLGLQLACVGICIIVFFVQGNIRRKL